MKLLLEREEVNPDRADKDGQTPLMIATMCGHERMRALLEFHKAEPTARFDP